MTLAAKRIAPGRYSLFAASYAFTVKLEDDSTWRWEVQCREEPGYDQAGFDSKKAALAYVEDKVVPDIQGPPPEERAAERARLATRELCYLWVRGFDRRSTSIPDRSHVIRQILPAKLGDNAAWVGSARKGDEVIDLITWYGAQEDADMDKLKEYGGAAVSTERSVPKGYN